MKITYALTVVVALAGVPSLVHAGDVADTRETGFYLGVGAGGSSYSGNLDHQIASAYAGYPAYHFDSAKLSDDSDNAYKFFGGYHFLPWLAVELAWTDLGKAKSLYRLTGLTSQPAITGRYRLHGITGALSAEYPLGERFAIGGRLGLFASRLNYRESSAIALETSTGAVFDHHFEAATETQTKPMAGASISWKAESNWELRFDWDRYFGIGTRFNLTADGNGRFDHIDQYSVDLLYHFDN